MALGQADRFLAACTRAALAGEPSPPWPDDRADPALAAQIVERAAFHGITVLLGRAPAMLDAWPEAAAAGVRHEMRLAGLWEELHRTHIAAIIEALAAAGIESMLLKGTALAYLHYDDPAVRRRGDTDLLIRPADLAAARRVLAAAGCTRREDPHGLVFQETWLIDCGAGMLHSLDLHWQPSDRLMLQKILDPHAYWRNRVPVPRLSPSAAAPDAQTMLLHGAVNQTWHCARGYGVEGERITGGRRLIWAVDYRMITQGFDEGAWHALADACERTDAAGIVGGALAGARADIDLAVPGPVMARLESAAPGSASLAYITDPGVLRDFWRDLRAAGSLGLRARLVKAMLLAPRSHLIAKYPRCAHWPTALLQLRRYSQIFGRSRGALR